MQRIPTRMDIDGGAPLRDTRNDIPAATRADVTRLLNARLADCIDLQTMCKQAHWNVRGRQFISLHELFDEIAAAVSEYADLLAERIAQLGGSADGTARIVAQRSTLLDYPLTLRGGSEHVTGLSDVLAQFGRATRIAVEEMNALEDAASADILVEITRGIDAWLWKVEAHGDAA